MKPEEAKKPEAPILSSELVAYFSTVQKTIQEYVQSLRRYNTYRSMVPWSGDGTVLDDRSRLIDLYEACLTQDSHLRGVIETLYTYLTGERYALGRVDASGEWRRDAASSEVIGGSLFEKIVKGIIDSYMYGFTLLDIRAGASGLVSVGCVERRNVLPGQGRVVLRSGQWEPGWDLSEGRFSRNYVLFDTGGLGLFATTTPVVLAKKFTHANWVNFAHIYGQPILHAKSEATDEATRKSLARNIASAIEKKVVVTGSGDSLDIKTFPMSNSEKIYESLIHNANSEVSNLILGSESMAGATQSYVGSTKAHEDIFRNRVKMYRKMVENAVNERVMPLLEYWGAVPSGLTFKYSNQIDMSTQDKIRLFDMLTDKFKIDPEVIEKEFGVRVGDQVFSSGGGIIGADGEPIERGNGGDDDRGYGGGAGSGDDGEGSDGGDGSDGGKQSGPRRMSDEEYYKRYGHGRANFLLGRR